MKVYNLRPDEDVDTSKIIKFIYKVSSITEFNWVAKEDLYTQNSIRKCDS